MFSATSGSGWAEMVFQAKFVLEGVLLPAVGSVGIMGEWEASDTRPHIILTPIYSKHTIVANCMPKKMPRIGQI